jgi:hypothetical protein
VGHSPQIVARRKSVHVRNAPKATAGGQDVACRLLLRKPSTAEDAVRIANTVARLIRVVQRGRATAAATAPTQSLAEYLAGRAGRAGASEVVGAPPDDKTHQRGPQNDGEASGEAGAA